MSETHKFLSDAQQIKLAEALDKKFNLPLVKGGRERAAWVKFVAALDALIAEKVQDEYLDSLNDPDFQLENAVAEVLKENLAPILAEVLKVPIIPFFLKVRLIEFLLDLMVSAMASATTIDETVEEFLRNN